MIKKNKPIKEALLNMKILKDMNEYINDEKLKMYYQISQLDLKKDENGLICGEGLEANYLLEMLKKQGSHGSEEHEILKEYMKKQAL